MGTASRAVRRSLRYTARRSRAGASRRAACSTRWASTRTLTLRHLILTCAILQLSLQLEAVREEAIFNNFATSVEMPAADGTEFIFSLRQGVKIQSQSDNPAAGEELTSHDVRESFVRRGTAITAPDKRFPLKISGTGSPDADKLRAALQTPDPYTFSFKLSDPFIPAFREMSNPTWAIVPAKVIEKYGTFQAGGLGQKAWGSGPFMLTEFRGTERIILKRHPEYFLNPKPWLDRSTTSSLRSRSPCLPASTPVSTTSTAL